jgi:hypothetical protein
MVSLTFRTTPPGADVFLDSADTLKITPAIVDVAEGTHNYLLRLNGCEDISGTITIVAGNSYTIDAVMVEISSMQQQFNKQMVQLGWAGLALAAVGIFIALMQGGKKGG